MAAWLHYAQHFIQIPGRPNQMLKGVKGDCHISNTGLNGNIVATALDQSPSAIRVFLLVRSSPCNLKIKTNIFSTALANEVRSVSCPATKLNNPITFLDQVQDSLVQRKFISPRFIGLLRNQVVVLRY